MENCHYGMTYPALDQFVEEGCRAEKETAAYGRGVTWTFVPGRGRGLLACRDMAAGTVVDMAPAVGLKDDEGSAHVRQYVFQCRRDGCAEPYTGAALEALVFGPMALCNHAEQPNARVCFKDSETRGLEARLIATQSIAKGEEITIRYTDSDWYEDNRLF